MTLELRIVAGDHPSVKAVDIAGACPFPADYGPGQVAVVGLRDGTPVAYVSARLQGEEAVLHRFAYIPARPERRGLVSAIPELRRMADWLLVFLMRQGFTRLLFEVDHGMPERAVHRRILRRWGAVPYAETATDEWWVKYAPAGAEVAHVG